MNILLRVVVLIFKRLTSDNSWIYISGPMSHYPKLNFPLFNKIAKQLRARGIKVINPAELLEGPTWIDSVRVDLIMMLLCCDKVATLPGWKNSRGASGEAKVAKLLYMRVHTAKYWLKRGV